MRDFTKPESLLALLVLAVNPICFLTFHEVTEAQIHQEDQKKQTEEISELQDRIRLARKKITEMARLIELHRDQGRIANKPNNLKQGN